MGRGWTCIAAARTARCWTGGPGGALAADHERPATFLELLAAIGGESKVALEATYGWEWLAEPLEDVGYELRLAHPLRTKAIATARVKTDSVDARIILAHLLRPDLLPEAHLAQGGSSVARRPRAPSPRSTGSSGRR